MIVVFLLTVIIACQRKGAGEASPGSKSESKEIVKVDSAAIYAEEGQNKVHSGDNNGAIEEFNKAIGINPKNADAYYWRAVAKCYLNDNAGCCEDYAKAEKLGHPSATAMIQKYCK